MNDIHEALHELIDSLMSDVQKKEADIMASDDMTYVMEHADAEDFASFLVCQLIKYCMDTKTDITQMYIHMMSGYRAANDIIEAVK